MGVAAPDQPPALLWPGEGSLAASEHCWVVGGTCGPGVRFVLTIGGAHAVALERFAMGVALDPVEGPPGTPHASVERLAPSSPLIVGARYELWMEAPSRRALVGSFEITAPRAHASSVVVRVHERDPRPPSPVPLFAPTGGAAPLFVEVEADAPVLVEARAEGGGARIEVLATSGGVVVAPRLREGAVLSTLRVLAMDGTVLSTERTTPR